MNQEDKTSPLLNHYLERQFLGHSAYAPSILYCLTMLIFDMCTNLIRQNVTMTFKVICQGNIAILMI